MRRNKSMSFRVRPEEKKLLEQAAYSSRAASLQAFLRTTALEAARRVERPPKSKLGQTARTLGELKLLCSKASGGGPGYWAAGRAIAPRLGRLIEQKPRSARDELRCIGPMQVDDQGVTSLLRWCKKHLGKLLDHVPKRRHQSFVAGIIKAIREGEATLLVDE